MTDLDALFAWQQRRIKLTGASGYLGPIRLSYRAHAEARTPADPETVRQSVLRGLGRAAVPSSEDVIAYCACGALVSEQGRRCRPCAGKLSSGSFAVRKTRGVEVTVAQKACRCGKAIGARWTTCAACMRANAAARALKRRQAAKGVAA